MQAARDRAQQLLLPARPASAEELDLLNRLDRIFTEHPVYGSRRLQVAAVTGRDFRASPVHPTTDVQTGLVFSCGVGAIVVALPGRPNGVYVRGWTVEAGGHLGNVGK